MKNGQPDRSCPAGYAEWYAKFGDLLDARKLARRRRDFKEADRIRQQLEEKGVDVLAIDRYQAGPIR